MRYRVSRAEKLAVHDLIYDNPYLWNRELTEEDRKLYASAWIWFKPMTRDQAYLRELYLDDAHADLGPVEIFSLPRFLLAWSIVLTVLYAIGQFFRYLYCTP